MTPSRARMGAASPKPREGRPHWRPTLAPLLAIFVGFGFGECHQSHDAHQGHAAAPVPSTEHSAHPAGSVSGYAPIAIASGRVGPLGLTTTKVEERDFRKQLRTVGVVALDETRTAHVHAKVRGFVESLSASYVSKAVKRGEVLCAIYSQTVYAAELEYLSLLRSPGVVTSSEPDAAAAEKKDWSAVVEAARRRLLLWDVPKSVIDRVEKTGAAVRTYPLFSPRDGTLVAKQAVLGTYVEPGTQLFTISDLTHVWVLIDVYEADLPNVKLGDMAKLSIEGIAEPVDAKITFISPTIDESTRTLKVRLDLDDPDRKTRPGAFVTAELAVPLGRGLALPESAVIRTGSRNIVFVVHQGHIEPREVTFGSLVAGYYRVTQGVALGEEVATGAQFLIDSESRLRATGMAGGHGGH